MKAIKFHEWLLTEMLKGNITKDTELKIFADYGDIGIGSLEVIEYDEKGDVVVSNHE